LLGAVEQSNGILEFMLKRVCLKPIGVFFTYFLQHIALPGVLFLTFMGCSKSEPVLTGFGSYKFGKSTLADGYRCEVRGEQTFCFLNPSPPVAGHKTQTDLFFDGYEVDAPLAEIRVGVWQCKVGPVLQDLETRMGVATQVHNNRYLWKLKKMTVIARLPKSKDLCMIHFLQPKNQARITTLFPAKK